jgi:phosphinothricin acetyltransferase
MIRLATPADLPRIVEIYNQTIPLRNVTADTEMVSVESRKEWFEGFSAKRPLWVLEEEGNVCAWLSFKSFYGRPAYQHTVEIGMYIDEQYRAKGIGSTMLLHAFAAAPALDIKTILAFIFGNNTSSIRFFEKHGFLLYGNLPAVAEIEGVAIDLQILGYKIP